MDPSPIRNLGNLVSFPKENCTFQFSCFSLPLAYLCLHSQIEQNYVFLLNFLGVAFMSLLQQLLKKEVFQDLKQQSARIYVYFKKYLI